MRELDLSRRPQTLVSVRSVPIHGNEESVKHKLQHVTAARFGPCFWDSNQNDHNLLVTWRRRRGRGQAGTSPCPQRIEERPSGRIRRRG